MSNLDGKFNVEKDPKRSKTHTQKSKSKLEENYQMIACSWKLEAWARQKSPIDGNHGFVVLTLQALAATSQTFSQYWHFWIQTWVWFS